MIAGKKIKSFVVIVLIVSVFSLQIPKAEAIIPVSDHVHTVFTSIFSALNTAGVALTNASIGFTGTGAATKGAQEAAKTGCVALRKAVQISDAAGAVTAVSSAVVGEGYTKVTKLTARLTALKALQTCDEIYLKAIKVATAGTSVAGGLQSINVSGFNEIQVQSEIDTLDKQIDDTNKLRTEAIEQVWKAIAIRMLMRAQQTITTNLVKSMTKKYKISNYQDYAGALASQVYAVDYVNKNFPDNRDQMIVKSMMKGGLTQNTAWPLIQSQAEENLGFDPVDLDIKSDNYYTDLASVGAANTNPYILKIIADDKAQQTISQSQLDAKAEINSSEGMISMRSCRDVSKAEQDKDREYTRLKAQFDLDEATFNKLRSRQIIDPQSVPAADFVKAVTNLAKSRTALNNYAAGNKAFEKPCDLIDNPGASLAKYTNSYLASHLGSTANLKETNLPFFAGFLESTASNFLTNIIFQSSPGSQNLTDRGLATPDIKPAEATTGVTQTSNLKQDFEQTQVQNVVLSGDKTSSSGNEFNLSWDASDYVTEANSDGSYVIITGPLGLNKQFSELKGSMLVGNPQGGVYTLKIYVRGQLAVTKTWVMPPLSNVDYKAPKDPTQQDAIDNAESNQGNVDLPPVPPPAPEPVGSSTVIVLGAIHYASPIQIRGPQAGVILR